MHVFNLYSILSYTVLGKLNDKKQAVRDERPTSLIAAMIFVPSIVFGIEYLEMVLTENG
jgi:hypothetical protein